MKKIILSLLSVFILIAAFRNKEITITGNVTNETGSAISFAFITAGSAATTADANGNYKITLNEKQEYLTVSAMGYETQKIKIRRQKVINVIMKAPGREMSEVIVTRPALKSKQLNGKVSSLYYNASPALISNHVTRVMSNIIQKNTAILLKMGFIK